MDNSPTAEEIFKKGSTTYFYSSLFFPPDIKRDVFTLYAFVRVADDMVDAVPAKKRAFVKFKATYHQRLVGKGTADPIIDPFLELQRRKKFDPKWITAFLDTMTQDLSQKKYASLKELENYMFGSAEVIGLMMAKILSLPTASYKSAKLLGKSMQYINFLRDIQEDIQLGRTYLPQEILNQYGFSILTEKTARAQSKAFFQLITGEVARYKTWQKQAEVGFKYIPKRYRIPIQTANAMYGWTADQIVANPFIIFQKKVKPSRFRLLAQALWLSLV